MHTHTGEAFKATIFAAVEEAAVLTICEKYHTNGNVVMAASKATFIRPDGQQGGTLIELITNPMYPTSRNDLFSYAVGLATELLNALQQDVIHVHADGISAYIRA